MFNAVYLVTYAAGMDDAAKEAFQSNMQELAAAVSEVNLVSPLLMGSYPGGDLYVEVGFADQAAYEAAKAGEAFAALDAAAKDESTVANLEFAAFGEGKSNFTDGEAYGHRVLLFHVLDNATEELKAEMEENIIRFPTFVTGMVNCKICKVVESSGSNQWDYAFECDYDTPYTYVGAYLATPYHWGFIDRYFEPSAKEFFIDPNLTSVYCAAPSAFLANFR